jgi:hypothetical protein
LSAKFALHQFHGSHILERPGPTLVHVGQAVPARQTGGQRPSVTGYALAALHPRNDTFPGEVFLRLAAEALEWCGASPADPLPLEGLRERFLPEDAFRGRQNAKLRYAVLAAAAVHGGTEPDLLDEVAYWQAEPILTRRTLMGCP